MLRRVAAGIALATIVGASVAVAAGLTWSAESLGADDVAVGRCTTAGLSVLPTLSGSSIASVTVSALPAGCGNASLKLTVNNGAANSSGTATVPAGGGNVTVTLVATVAVTTQVQTDLLLTGP